jgi:hypothetical protein
LSIKHTLSRILNFNPLQFFQRQLDQIQQFMVDFALRNKYWLTPLYSSLTAIITTLPPNTPFFSDVHFAIFPSLVLIHSCILSWMISNVINRQNFQNKLIPSPATVSTDNYCTDPPLYIINHNFAEHICYQEWKFVISRGRDRTVH